MGESGAKMAQQLTVASTAGTVIVEGSFPVASCGSSTAKADTRIPRTANLVNFNWSTGHR